MISVDVALKLGAFDLDVAFASDAGITALFGRSGAGKSMTISLIAGLARPDRGSIVLDDRILVDTARAHLRPGLSPPHRARVPGCAPLSPSQRQAEPFVRTLVRTEDRAERRLQPRGRDARHRSSPQAEASRPLRRREAESGDRPGAAFIAQAAPHGRAARLARHRAQARDPAADRSLARRVPHPDRLCLPRDRRGRAARRDRGDAG